MMQNQEWLPSIRVDTSDPYHMGLQIGRRFQHLIKSRISKNPFLRSQLLPFAATHEGHQLLKPSLLLTSVAVKFSKRSQVYHAEECSDIAICSSLAVLGHNEDANVSVKDHVFLVHARLSTQASFTSFTLVGKLPSCAFGFNTYGVGFTLNAVPLSPQEIVAGGIGRNFISRDLLEATCLQSACKRVQVKELALGHSYNIFDIGSRRIVNVETASKGRFSVKEIGAEPFFHVNMYKHLEVSQVEDQSSIHRHARAAELSKCTKDDFLSVLGDTEDRDYPIYMEGPPANTLYRFGGHGCQKAYYI